MASKVALVLLAVACLVALVSCGEHKHHKVIIHVPYKVHTIHHHSVKKVPIYHYYEKEDHHHHHHHHAHEHHEHHEEEHEEHGWD